MRLTRFMTVPTASWRWALVALRTFLGVIYFTNGLAKLLSFSHFTIGPWTQYLIDRPGARGILAFNIHNANYGIPIAKDFARDFVLPHWDVIGWVVTAGELGVGVGLLLGIFGRLAALGGFLMASVLFVWDLGAGGWTYDYLYDVVLLGILMLTPGLPGLGGVVPFRRRRPGDATAPRVGPAPLTS